MRYSFRYRRATYIILLISGRLNNFPDICSAAAHGKAHSADETTEQLKAEKWVQKMYNIRACARVIVEREFIYN